MSFISLTTSFSLGVIHALEPGHGKAFLASLITGKNISNRNLLLMTLTIGVSHSLLLVILAFLVPLFFPHLEETIHIFIQIIASTLILYLGIRMLINAKKQKNESTSCSCGIDHGTTPVNHIKPNTQFTYAGKSNLNTLTFSKAPTQPVKESTNIHETTKKETLWIGFINGITPCPSALAVIGIAVTNSNFWIVSSTMLLYVIGFILTMLLIAYSLVKFKVTLLKNSSFSSKKTHYISGILIILSGLYYLYLGLNHTH